MIRYHPLSGRAISQFPIGDVSGDTAIGARSSSDDDVSTYLALCQALPPEITLGSKGSSVWNGISGMRCDKHCSPCLDSRHFEPAPYRWARRDGLLPSTQIRHGIQRDIEKRERCYPGEVRDICHRVFPL